MKFNGFLKEAARNAQRKRLYRWMPALLLLALLASAWAFGQGANDMPTKFCYANDPLRCSDTLEGAEKIMRVSPENAQVVTLLEPYYTEPNPTTKLAVYRYFVRDQPGTLYDPSFALGLNDGLVSMGDCVHATDPNNLANCASEDEFVAKAVDKYRRLFPSCTFTPATMTQDLRMSPYKDVDGMNVINITSYGMVHYGVRAYSTIRTCSGTVTTLNFQVNKEASYTCPQQYTRLSDSTPNDGKGDLTLPVLCKYNNGNAIITGPIKQCASCAASKYPCFPATGDKARIEPDFEFSGRTFTRYYHSLHELTSDPSSAIGWSHTFGDRLYGSAGLPRISVVSESGTYESFVYMDTGRYRGENSVDTWIQPFSSGTVRWRLLRPSGEYRDFDVDGLLVKIGEPSDPRQDITLTYANGLLSKATDGQGRAIAFVYDASKMLRQVVESDGGVIGYTYDANRNLTAVTYPDGTVRTYLYAETGLIADPMQKNLMTGIVAEDGQRYASFKYDLLGRVIESRAFGQPNNVTTVTYSSDTSAAVGTDTGDVKTYTIEPGQYSHITGMQSQGQQSLDSQSFDAAGRLQSSTDKRGVVTTYEYDATNSSLSATNEAVGTTEQRRIETTRDVAINQPTEVRILDASGVLQTRLSRTYNARAQVTLISMFDPISNTTRDSRLRYCEAADITAGTCPMLGLLLEADGPRTDVQDRTTFTYRNADDPGCAATPANCSYRKGDLWKVTNALGQSVEYVAYDSAGRVRAMRDANGVRTEVEYNARGWLTAGKVRGADEISEADSRITRLEYDATGTVHRTLLPDGSSLTFTYDGLQRLTAIVDGNGDRMVYTLDAAGNRVREESKNSAGTVSQSISRVYDTLGRLQSIVDAQANHVDMAYDDGDNPIQVTDPLMHRTARTFDALGRLRSMVEDVGGVAAQTQTRYDALGRVTRVTDPGGLNTDYGYNGFGDLLSLNSPDTGNTTSTYDAAGNLKTKQDARGVVATYSYDALNRLTGIAYPDSSLNISYTFDTPASGCGMGENFGVGRLSTISDKSGTTALCFDRYGNVARKYQVTQGRQYALRYLYTNPRGRVPGQDYAVRRPLPANQMIGVTYPDGSGVRIARDANGRARDLSVILANGQTQTLLSGGTYYPFGAIAQWRFGNGRVLNRTRNQNGQPGIVQDSSPGGISVGYEFDATGNLKTLRNGDQVDPPQRRYRYDGLDRIVQTRDGADVNVLQSYAYNATGDRTGSTNGGIAQTYTYAAGSHRMASVGAELRTYDAMGNTIRIGGAAAASAPIKSTRAPMRASGRARVAERMRAIAQVRNAKRAGASAPVRSSAIATAVVRDFMYDDAGRMRQVKRDGVVAMDYLYNGKGERVYRGGSGQSVATLYDEAGHWIGDYDNTTGAPLQQAIWLDDLPVGLLVGAGANQKLYYVEADALGTPRVLIDPTRDVAVWRWDLTGEAFGKDVPNEDPDADGIAFTFDMRFPGQRYDSAMGMSYNYFRDYDATTGRYVESDPIGLNGGMSTYGYVEEQPLSFTDPYGLETGMFQGDQYRMPLPKGISAKDSHDAMTAFNIMSALNSEMKDRNIVGTDQFYHCLAACRATQATNNPSIVLELMATKEVKDYYAGRIGLYGDGKARSHSEMQEDNKADMDVNKYGASCKKGENCVRRCMQFVPKGARKFLSNYVPEWKEK